MRRIEFTLSMPNRGSWNGGWSGAGNRYAIIRKVDDRAAIELDGKYWHHSWPDGWGAGISARLMEPGERAKPSAGFSGYDWMVADILAHGKIRPYGAPKHWPASANAATSDQPAAALEG
jgi:hypothetical protein